MDKDNKSTEVDNTDKKLHISDVMCSLLCWIGVHKKTLIWKSNYHSKYKCSRCKLKFIHEHHLGGRKYRVS